MPNINDIVMVAEALEKSPLAISRDRCVAVRNRNASCRKCVDACSFNALTVSANEITHDAGSCASCGACTAACPTEALSLVKPTDDELAAAAAKAATENDGVAVIACARISSKRLANPSQYAEAYCLARIEESLLLNLAAHGAEGIILVDGDCPTCKYRDCTRTVEETVLFANELIAAHGGHARVTRASAFPENMHIQETSGLFGSTRRSFFSDAAGAARETAMTAARTTITHELGTTVAERSIGERLRVTDDGSMPRLDMPRHDTLINAMDALGAPTVENVESRRFANVCIDTGKCNACGMCGVFCPTGALRRADGGAASAQLQYLEFSMSECVQCGLCADVCWKDALTISSKIPTAQLFDFEPVTFDLSKAVGVGNNPFR